MMSIKFYLQCKRLEYDARRWLLANDSVKLATHCLFHLNRHARGIKRGGTKNTVYDLKNNLVRWLYQNGYCVASERQVQTLECWHTWDYNNGWEDWCEKCGNTGVYAEHVLYRFVFKISNQIYIWHQPEQFVDWPVEGDKKWIDELRKFQPDYLDHIWLDRPIRLLYIYTVWQFLKMQDVQVAIKQPNLKNTFRKELLCQTCGGYGWTKKQRWDGARYNYCHRCFTKGKRWRWLNTWLFWRARINHPHSLPYQLQEADVPFFVQWLEKKQQTTELQSLISEDEIPF